MLLWFFALHFHALLSVPLRHDGVSVGTGSKNNVYIGLIIVFHYSPQQWGQGVFCSAAVAFSGLGASPQ